jgi:hypothetical protein
LAQLSLSAGGDIDFDNVRRLSEDLPLAGSYSFLASKMTGSPKTKPGQPIGENTADSPEKSSLAMLPLIPGDWQTAPDPAQAARDFADLLSSGVLGARVLPQDQVRFAVRPIESCHALSVMEASGALFLPFRLAWLRVEHADKLAEVAAIPEEGLLNLIAIDLFVETMLSDDATQEWAALFVALEPGKNGPRRPIGEEDPLPLLPGASLPAMAGWERCWRTVAFRPEGIVVYLPWLEGQRLVRGHVLVTPNGVDCRVLSEHIIEDNLPVFVENWVGALRFLTPAGRA